MDLVEQVHIFGLANIHTFGPNIKLIRLFTLMFNYAKPPIDNPNMEHAWHTNGQSFHF